MTDLETVRAPLAERALAERVRVVPPSGIRRFFDILATMDDVISLGVGEPDFDTPPQIVEAGVESLREGRTHYTCNYGTIELRRALSTHLERLYGVSYDPARDPDHRRRVRGASTSRSRRPATRATRCPPRAVVRRLRARDRVRRRRRPPRRHVRRERLRPRSRRRRGGDHAAHQGAVPRLPVQPDRRGASTTTSRTSSPGSPCGTTCSCTATRSTTGSPTATYRHRAFSSLARDARADDPDGRLLQGLRDDRLAGRLDVRAARRSSRGSSRSTSTGSCRRRRRPRTRPSRRSRRASRTCRRWSRSTTGDGGCSSTGSTPLGLPTFEPRGAFYAFPDDQLDRPDVGGVHRAAAARGEGRGRPGRRVRAVGRRATCACATRRRYEQLEEAVARIDAVRGARIATPRLSRRPPCGLHRHDAACRTSLCETSGRDRLRPARSPARTPPRTYGVDWPSSRRGAVRRLRTAGARRRPDADAASRPRRPLRSRTRSLAWSRADVALVDAAGWSWRCTVLYLATAARHVGRAMTATADAGRRRSMDRYEAVIGIEIHCQLQDSVEDVLRLLDRLRRRAAEHATCARSASACPAPCRSSTGVRSSSCSRPGSPSRRRSPSGPAGIARTTSIRTCPRATRSASTTSRSRPTGAWPIETSARPVRGHDHAGAPRGGHGQADPRRRRGPTAAGRPSSTSTGRARR